MLTGQKGVKYGLTVPKKDNKPLVKKNVFAFGDDDSDDEKQAVASRINRQAQQKQTDKKVAAMQAAALAEDPSIFDYDAHYEETQQQRLSAQPKGPPERKSKYIQNLLDKTKERNREQDIVYERRLLKERQVEDHLFGDKESFVTAAYKKKLEDDKKWQEEERLRDQVEAEQDVRKKGHMGDFYRNLLTRNVAMGAPAGQSTAATQSRQPVSSDPQAPSQTSTGAQEPSKPPQKGQDTESDDWQRARLAREALEKREAERLATQPESSREPPDDKPQNPPDRLQGIPAKDRRETAPGANQVEAEKPTLTSEQKAALARERFLARKRKTVGS